MFFREPIIKKITAVGFISILLVIFSVKAFHKHTHQNFSPHTSSVSALCAVCEFHFAKDGEPASFTSVAEITTSFFLPVSVYCNAYTPAFHSTIAGRGPPSLL